MVLNSVFIFKLFYFNQEMDKLSIHMYMQISTGSKVQWCKQYVKLLPKSSLNFIQHIQSV